MATKGRNGKFDQRITCRLDNRHNIEITTDLEIPKPEIGFSDAVRSCMVQAERDFSDHPEYIDMAVAALRQDGLISGETIKREFKAPEDFKEHFTLLCLRIGYDLNEYIEADLLSQEWKTKASKYRDGL